MSDSPWANFAYSELRCRCGRCDSTGREMDPVFMERLQRFRIGFVPPMPLTSAYRCAKHPSEANKITQGAHPVILAVYVPCNGADALELLHIDL